MLHLFSEIGKRGLFFMHKNKTKALVVNKEVAICVQELL